MVVYGCKRRGRGISCEEKPILLVPSSSQSYVIMQFMQMAEYVVGNHHNDTTMSSL